MAQETKEQTTKNVNDDFQVSDNDAPLLITKSTNENLQQRVAELEKKVWSLTGEMWRLRQKVNRIDNNGNRLSVARDRSGIIEESKTRTEQETVTSPENSIGATATTTRFTHNPSDSFQH